MILSPVMTGGSGLAVDHEQTDPFVATAGQTAFALSRTPVDLSDVDMKVNGVSYAYGVDYTILGTAVTWTGLFALVAGDLVEFTYNY